MKIGVIASVVVGAAAMGVGSYAFLTSATPYVSASEAIQRPGESVHIVGVLVPETTRNDPRKGLLEFDMKDDEGTLIRVAFQGPKPANFDTAPKLSIVGAYEGSAFRADKILVKCPSKYESEPQS